MRYKGILASSSDPSGETLSMTVQGIIIGASSIITFFGAHFFHLTIQATDITSLATEIGGVVASIVTIYGIIRKVINKVGTDAPAV